MVARVPAPAPAPAPEGGNGRPWPAWTRYPIAIVMKLEQSRAALQQTRARGDCSCLAVYKATRVEREANPFRSLGIGTCACIRVLGVCDHKYLGPKVSRRYAGKFPSFSRLLPQHSVQEHMLRACAAFAGLCTVAGTTGLDKLHQSRTTGSSAHIQMPCPTVFASLGARGIQRGCAAESRVQSRQTRDEPASGLPGRGEATAAMQLSPMHRIRLALARQITWGRITLGGGQRPSTWCVE